jgi:hypothetical protein
MTGYLNTQTDPISALTLAAFDDLGYEVRYESAEPYRLPSLRAMAALRHPTVYALKKVVLPTTPIVIIKVTPEAESKVAVGEVTAPADDGSFEEQDASGSDTEGRKRGVASLTRLDRASKKKRRSQAKSNLI